MKRNKLIFLLLLAILIAPITASAQVGIVTEDGYDNAPIAGARLSSSLGGVAYSNADGVYQLHATAPTNSTISVTSSADGFLSQSKTAQVTHTSVTQLNFALRPLQPRAQDVNDDFKLNALDVQLVINNANSANPNMAADVNGDRLVNAIDIQQVINAVVGR